MTRTRMGSTDISVRDGEHDFAARVALLEVAYGLVGLAQRISPVDDGRELAGLYQVFEHHKVLMALLGHEAKQLLLREARANRGEYLALKAAEPAVSAFAADDDESASRLECPAQLRQGPPSRRVEDQVELARAVSEVLTGV